MRKPGMFFVPAVCLMALAAFFVACKAKKQLTAAKGNSKEYALAHCQCEKLKRKEPPGDLTRCTEQMARATRYLNINLEFGSFNEAEKQEIRKTGDEAFIQCMAN